MKQLKNLTPLILLITTITLSGCKSNKEEDLVGNWNSLSYRIMGNEELPNIDKFTLELHEDHTFVNETHQSGEVNKRAGKWSVEPAPDDFRFDNILILDFDSRPYNHEKWEIHRFEQNKLYIISREFNVVREWTLECSK